ncbi:MAG: hypothetical protein KA419_09255 [Acidobacteria bacterium]|nr:hypothetical protein [Acidobacteriota bacterium]
MRLGTRRRGWVRECSPVIWATILVMFLGACAGPAGSYDADSIIFVTAGGKMDSMGKTSADMEEKAQPGFGDALKGTIVVFRSDETFGDTGEKGKKGCAYRITPEQRLEFLEEVDLNLSNRQLADHFGIPK